MSFEAKITAEISSFFIHANNQNPSIPVKRWKDSKGDERTHLAYENCVSCGTKRFTSIELPKLRSGTDTYFCIPCYSKVAKVVEKYWRNEMFDKMWNDRLFGQNKF